MSAWIQRFPIAPEDALFDDTVIDPSRLYSLLLFQGGAVHNIHHWSLFFP
jgi:hypothetical protein